MKRGLKHGVAHLQKPFTPSALGAQIAGNAGLILQRIVLLSQKARLDGVLHFMS